MTGDIWWLRETGRRCRVLDVVSTSNSDTVKFRFLDTDQTTRSCSLVRFLADFMREPVQARRARVDRREAGARRKGDAAAAALRARAAVPEQVAPAMLDTPTQPADFSSFSLKRLAWAFGCSRKGSEEERSLRAHLAERLRAEDRIHAQERLAVESGWVELDE